MLAIKFQMCFCCKTDFTFLLQPINFKPLEINQSYIPHLKVLVCVINASSSQLCGWIFILGCTHLKLALLRHKQGLVATVIGTTVSKIYFSSTLIFYFACVDNVLIFYEVLYPTNFLSGDVFSSPLQGGLH